MSLFIGIDWAKSGNFTDPFDGVTSNLRGGPGASFECSFGRDQSTALTPTVAGRGTLELDNRSRRYSPRNTSSPLYGSLKPARPVIVQRVVNGVTYNLFAGHTDDSPINPSLEAKSVSFTLLDWLADFRGQTVTTSLYSGIRTGTAIGYILDAVGWTGGRDLDPGVTYIPWWWEDGTDAADALEKLVRSEGPPALLTIAAPSSGSVGTVTFRDRHHRLFDASSLTSQSTWRSKNVEPIMQRPFTYDEGWRLIVNDAAVSVGERRPGDQGPIWTSDATITLSAGEQTMLTGQSTDPFFDAQTPVQDVDYTLLSGGVTIVLTRTSGGSTGIVLTAGASGAVIEGLQVRATPLPVTHTVRVSAADSTSINDYGSRGLPSDLPWCNRYDAEAICIQTVAQRAQPLTQLQVTFVVGKIGARAPGVLARNLSDRVTVVEAETQVNGDFYVESIAHSLSGEDDHEVTIGLEAVPSDVTPVFRFDTAGAGFNDGLFASGLSSPANVFTFDGGSGHRFDEGVFAL